jgi:hypothetical protein
LCCSPAPAQTNSQQQATPAQSQAVPAGWKIVKDARAECQIAVPPEWAPLGENKGAAMLRDSTTAVVVVTSQAGQNYKPLTPAQLKTFGVAKEKMFENSSTRLFYQDRTSDGLDEPNAFNSSVPGKNGTCSCHVSATPSVPEDVAKKIALSLSAVPPT